ncbi:MAG: ankyrin repeat domain-containing protein [Acidobacteriota bacterium]
MSAAGPDLLLEAVKEGRVDAVERMLDESPALLEESPEGRTSPILLALYYRHPEVAAVFVRRGAKLDVFEAAALGDSARLAELLADDPSRADAFAADGFFPLGLAAFFGRRGAVRTLLDAGADVHAEARNGMRVQALHSAAAAHDAEIVRALLESGADPNAAQQAGYRPLHEAAGQGDAEIAHLLLEAGARLDLGNDDGKTPRDLAIEKGHGDLVARLEAAAAADRPAGSPRGETEAK